MKRRDGGGILQLQLLLPTTVQLMATAAVADASRSSFASLGTPPLHRVSHLSASRSIVWGDFDLGVPLIAEWGRHSKFKSTQPNRRRDTLACALPHSFHAMLLMCSFLCARLPMGHASQHRPARLALTIGSLSRTSISHRASNVISPTEIDLPLP